MESAVVTSIRPEPAGQARILPSESGAPIAARVPRHAPVGSPHHASPRDHPVAAFARRQNLVCVLEYVVVKAREHSVRGFADGNGRTGRILNIVFLVEQGLLDSPILYLSRFIIQNKADYYRLLKSVTNDQDWAGAQAYLEQVLEVDPTAGQAHAMLAMTLAAAWS